MMRGEENILKQAGLSEEQALVYQSLLEKGPQKASPLSQWTGIKRGLIYKVLEQLEIMNLVEKKGGAGTVAIFYPNHPSTLLDKIERDKKSLELARDIVSTGLGNLSSKYNLLAGKPNVRFFEGEEAIEQITRDYPKKEKEIRQWIDMQSALNQIKNQTVNYKEERIKKGISKKIILTDKEENRNYAKNNPEMTEFKFQKTNLPTAIQVYEDKVTMLTLDENKKVGFIIEDPSIAETLKNIFDNSWKNSKDFLSETE